jgi:hypothetical protein
MNIYSDFTVPALRRHVTIESLVSSNPIKKSYKVILSVSSTAESCCLQTDANIDNQSEPAVHNKF